MARFVLAQRVGEGGERPVINVLNVVKPEPLFLVRFVSVWGRGGEPVLNALDVVTLEPQSMVWFVGMQVYVGGMNHWLMS